MCCDVVNRGPAFFDVKFFYNTLDTRTVAVDAAQVQGAQWDVAPEAVLDTIASAER